MSRVLVISDLPGFEISEEGYVWRTCNGGHRYKLTPFVDKRGYYNFYVHFGNKRKHLKLHYLLAKAFISNPQNLSEVMHLDGNKLNNNLDNLAWGSHKDNLSAKNWHHNRGENCGTSKLTWPIIGVIRKLVRRKYPVTNIRLAEYFNVKPEAISRVKRRITWQE